MTKQIENIEVYHLSEDIGLDQLSARFQILNDDQVIIISANELETNSKGSLREKYNSFQSDIVFGSSAEFKFNHNTLSYYYWKYYPRQKTPYHYLNGDFIIGKAGAIRKSIEDVASYKMELSFEEMYHRLYVDTYLNFFRPEYSLKIDHEQLLYGNTNGRKSVIQWPLFSRINAYLFFLYERISLEKRGFLTQRNAWKDYAKRNDGWYNKKTKSYPILFPKETSSHSITFSAFLSSTGAYLKSLFKTLTVLLHNKGEYRFYKIFRYAPNEGKDVSKGINTLMDLLKNHVPFCFSHFNDGELTFISKHEKGDHKEVWFGRRQNQYTKKLGKLLVEAFLLRKKNYFVGIPCAKSHPSLRKKATDLRTPDEFTIAAMTLHHNINRYPEVLGLLKNRELYFVVNPYQDLAFFEDLGLSVKKDQMIVVPFKNSHKEYDNLKDHKFKDGSVVLMMCGMLGKVLTPYWFEHNPNATFLTFGSSFDDFIQKNINFKLVPKEAPFARHIIGTRSFLFGAKKRCEDCFDLKNPESE